MSEFIEILSKESKDDIDKMIRKLDQIAGQVNKINSSFDKIKVPSQASKEINRTRTATNKLNAEQKEAQRLSRTLAREKAKLNRANGIQAQGIQRLRFENRETNKRVKEAAILSSRLATEYQKQQVVLTQLIRKQQDLALKQANGNKLTKEERRTLKRTTAEIKRKDRALKEVDRSVGRYTRNVGNYSSAWRGVTNVLRASVAAFGVYSALDIGRQIFAQIKEINSLDLALKKVTKSTNEYNNANIFLSNLANRTGSDINRLQRAYVKFLASAQTTNLTLDETQEIFENVSTAAAVLGQSSEDTEGALRALEQMLSKGKVQAEEIRGQLGERLPGAFQILARAVGMTTQELSKQLELGNIYSDEVLPKFARELAKTYSLDTINKVETLTAAQGRLGNAWKEFIRTVEDGGGRISSLLSDIFDKTTSVVDFFTDFNKSFERSMDEAKYGVDELVNSFKKGLSEMSEQDFEFAIQDKLMRNQEAINGYRRSLAELQKEQASMAASDVLDRMFRPNRLIERSREILKNISQLEEFNRLLLGGNAIKEDENKLDEENIENTKEKNRLKQEEINLLQTQGQILKGTLVFYEELISKLKEKQRTLPLNSEAWQVLSKAIKDAETQMEAFLRAQEGQDIFSQGFISPEINLEEYNKGLQEAKRNTDKLLAYIKKEFQKDIFSGQFARLGDMLNIDTSILEQSFDTLTDKASTAEEKIMSMAQGVGEIVGGIGQTLMQNELIRIDNLIAANDRYYNNLIEQAQGDSEQQDFLRREQEAKRRQLLRKRAEEQKKFAKLDIITNTAVAVIKTFANLGFPAGIPAAAAVAALGATQLALVESQPIPEYKTGRKGGKEEYAILGDGYKEEAVIGKDGKLKGISPDKPTLTHLDQGDSVIPSLNHSIARSAILDSITMNSNKMNKGGEVQSQIDALRNENKRLKKDIIGSLRSAKFINQNNTSVDLNFPMKKLKYKGK